MSKDFNFSISSYKDLFSDEIQESLYDSVFPDNSIMNLEEPTYESLLSLLIETNRNTKENIQKTTSDESSSNRVQFLVEKKFINKKRGRKTKGKNKNKKTHTNTREDNLLTKIQIHFFNFVINFCNDALKEECPNSKAFFKKINYEKKKDVKYSYTSSLKEASIKYLLKMDISIKHKKCGSSYNKDLLGKIKSSYPSLSKLFEMKYLELFEKYYNKGNPLNEIVYENKIIKLEKAKSKAFYNLIDKYKNLKKYLIDISEKYYIDNIKA